MREQQLKASFTQHMLNLNMAVMLYKIEIDDYGDGRGYIRATNAHGCTLTAYYDTAFESPFVEWEVRV